MTEFNIQIASNLTGLSIHTLRTWEKRYQVVTPRRLANGRRVYSQEDIEKLKLLNELCALGHSIGQIANKGVKELSLALEKHGVITHSVDSEKLFLNRSPDFAKKTLSHLLMALKNYRLDVISHELYNLKMTMPPKDLALDVLSPLLKQVGIDVFEGKLSIAQEHALSSIIKFHLGKFIYQSFEENRFQKGKELIILTTPEGDYHEFGILLASLLCIQHKRNFIYLGPNMPYASIVEAVKNLGAKEVIIGTTIATADKDSSFLTDYITMLIKGLPRETQLTIGGSGFFDTSKFQSHKNFTYLPTLEHFDHLLKKRGIQ